MIGGLGHSVVKKIYLKKHEKSPALYTLQFLAKNTGLF